VKQYQSGIVSADCIGSVFFNKDKAEKRH